VISPHADNATHPAAHKLGEVCEKKFVSGRECD
jgi:hypothetical protein